VEPVRVRFVGKPSTLIAEGGRSDDMVAFWWAFDEGDHTYEQLSFVLLDDGFLIAQPVTFDGDQRGWWYCDLISVDDHGSELVLEDLYVDVVVGPPTAPYRVLDLDELAAAVRDDRVGVDVALDGLRRCQSFLDRRLNPRRGEVSTSWPDFPPTATARDRWRELPRAWQWQPAPSR
jgi:hypothetical protein